MQINSVTQQSFGMNIKPLGQLKDIETTMPPIALKNFNKMCELLKKHDPDVDTYIRMTEATNLSGPRKCLIELLIPFKNSLGKWQQVSHSFKVTGINVKPKQAVATILSNPEFPYWLEKKSLVLANKYYGIVG